MFSSLVLGLGFVVTSPTESLATVAGPRDASPAESGGKSLAEREILSALRSEAEGRMDERNEHLERALRADPDNARARGLLGLVADRGSWVLPEAVADRVRSDASLSSRLALYNALRAEVPNTAEHQWALALWCEKNGLSGEALAHLTAVTRVAPHDRAAWERLGCRMFRGRWMNEEQIAAELAEEKAQEQADRVWFPRMIAWREGLADKAKRDESARALLAVREPRAIPSLMRAFGIGVVSEQAWAVKVLGNIDTAQAARALALLAVNGRSEKVRLAATRMLTRFDARTYLGQLINGLRDPIHYEARPVVGPGEPGILQVQDPRHILERRYDPPEVRVLQERHVGGAIAPTAPGPQVRRTATETSRVLADGTLMQDSQETITPVGEIAAERQRAADASQHQLDRDVRALEERNDQIRAGNAPIETALRRLTGQDLGQDRQAWASWWSEQLGYVYKRPEPIVDRPTVVQDVAPQYVPKPVTVVVNVRSMMVQPTVSHSCFGAETPVLSRLGPRPIESLRAGDQVLTQDPETGELSFQPILAVFHNKPSPVLRIALEGGEEIVATGIHRFWRPGEGWTMARDLSPGDRLRTLEGTARIASVSSERVQPVFNLEVARNSSFFVGRRAALVHDHSLVGPTRHPFDAGPSLATTAGTGTR